MQRQRQCAVHFARHGTRVFEHALAELGQRQAPGAALQQLLAQALLQQRQAAADRGLGQLQALGGPAEAAGVHHAGKEQEVVGIHIASHCSIDGTMISMMSSSGCDWCCLKFIPSHHRSSTQQESPP